MKIYILADMEGISGIRKIEEVQAEHVNEYEFGRKLMMQDINAAVDGCFVGGATEVIVADTHGGGGQVQMEGMDERALYEIPNKGLLMPSLDSTFDGVILLGHHAMAGTIDAFLDHTMSSEAWFEFRLNDQPMGEIGIEAAWAGHFDVPVIMVEGDEATAVEAKEVLDNVECAIVKWAIGRNRAKCLPLNRAHTIVKETAEKAVRNAANCKPFKPTVPGIMQLTLYRSDMADNHARRSDVTRVNARTVSKKVESLFNICDW